MIVLGIDQSISGTGACVLEDQKQQFIGTITTTPATANTIGRIRVVVNGIFALVKKYQPHVIVMEDYARQSMSNSETPLKELGGCIKWFATENGYGMEPEDIKAGRPVLMVQNQSQMKKWVLGNGAVSKDTRYLMTVLNKTGQQFSNDNEADAYMHAVMASQVYLTLQGKLPISNLLGYQQEVLFSQALKRRKGLSLNKAMKLSEEEKQRLIAA